MSLPFLFVLLALAVSRFLRLVQADHITERFRELVIYNRWPYDASRGAVEAEWKPELRAVSFVVRKAQGYEDVRPSPVGYWLSCPWCLGLWASAGAVVATSHYVSIPLPALWVAALSYTVGYLARYR